MVFHLMPLPDSECQPLHAFITINSCSMTCHGSVINMSKQTSKIQGRKFVYYFGCYEHKILALWLWMARFDYYLLHFSM